MFLGLYGLCNTTWKKLQERERRHVVEHCTFRQIRLGTWYLWALCTVPPLCFSSCAPSYQPQQLHSCICLANLLPLLLPSTATVPAARSPSLLFAFLPIVEFWTVPRTLTSSWPQTHPATASSSSLLLLLRSSRLLWNCRHAPCAQGPLPSREHHKLLAVSGET